MFYNLPRLSASQSFQATEVRKEQHQGPAFRFVLGDLGTTVGFRKAMEHRQHFGSFSLSAFNGKS